jgi:hypothetical protein
MPFHLSRPFLLRADRVIDYYAFAALQESAFGTSRRIAAVRRFGRDRSEADMPRPSGAARSDENDPEPT